MPKPTKITHTYTQRKSSVGERSMCNVLEDTIVSLAFNLIYNFWLVKPQIREIDVAVWLHIFQTKKTKK